MADSSKKPQAKKTDLGGHLKKMFPHMRDDHVASILSECHSDEKAVNAWIDSHLELSKRGSQPSSPTSKEWSEVSGKGSKKAKSRPTGDKPKAETQADDGKSGRGKAGGDRSNGLSGRTVFTRPSNFINRDQGVIEIIVPRPKLSLLLGSQGATLAQLKESNQGVQINIPDRSNGSSLVQIVGDREKVDKVINRISEIIGQQVVSGRLGWLTIDVPKRGHPLLIGKSGLKLSEIEKTHNCAIIVPQRDGSETCVTIEGKYDDCYKAKGLIEETCRTEVSVPFNVVVSDFPGQEAAAPATSTVMNGLPPPSRRPVQHDEAPQPTFDAPASANYVPPLIMRHITPEEMNAVRAADAIIEQLMSHSQFDLKSRVQGIPLPEANALQLHMRHRLRERLTTQRSKIEELKLEESVNVKKRDDLRIRHNDTKTRVDHLQTELKELKKKLEEAEAELKSIFVDLQGKQKVVDDASKFYAAEVEAADRLQRAVGIADETSRHITEAWVSWLLKLRDHTFTSWTLDDMSTLLYCLGIDSQILLDNGIEPTMLGHVDDVLLKDIRRNSDGAALSFGERRYILIAIRSILNEKRPPVDQDLSRLQNYTADQVVLYLMCWGLNVSPEKEVIVWNVDAVENYFRKLNMPIAAEACAAAHVCGAVLLTMYKKDCFGLQLSTLGDTVALWTEASRLQQDVFGKMAQTVRIHEAGVGGWTVLDVVQYLEARDLRELAQVCAREKISGHVLINIDRNEDLASVDFARPGDRIRLLQICKQIVCEPSH